MTDYFPTRYSSARDEIIGILSDVSEGYGKESTGNVDAPTGYFSLVHLDDSCDLDVTDTTCNYPVGDEAGEVARMFGVTADDIRGSHIVTSNDQGFVYVETFDTPDAAQTEYDCRAARFAEWDDDDRDPDGDGVYVCPVIGHGYHTCPILGHSGRSVSRQALHPHYPTIRKGKTMGTATLTIYRTTFLEDGIVDGDYGPDEETTRDHYVDVGVEDAIRWIRQDGLTFEASGSDWAADPEGSRIIDYGTGQREEVSAHLDGFTPAETAAIVKAVDAR